MTLIGCNGRLNTSTLIKSSLINEMTNQLGQQMKNKMQVKGRINLISGMNLKCKLGLIFILKMKFKCGLKLRR